VRKASLFIAFTLLISIFSPVPSQAYSSLSIGVAYDIGGRGDRSFNDAAAAGLEKAKKQFDFELIPVVTDGTSADREKRIRTLIERDCNPIIAIGHGYAATLQEMALEFPKIQFAIINDATVAAANVTSVIFADTQGAYLAGFGAAMISQSGKVAMIADSSQADLYQDGFAAGVAASKKKVTSIVKYVTGSHLLAANQVMDAGADILFVATQGSNSEVIKAIANRNREKKVSNFALINMEPDQFISVTRSTQRFLAGTVVKRVDRAIFDLVSSAASGRPNIETLDAQKGIYGLRYGIAGGGIELTVKSPALRRFSAAINLAAIDAQKIPA
jgi:basic membrane protein A and related proteins